MPFHVPIPTSLTGEPNSTQQPVRVKRAGSVPRRGQAQVQRLRWGGRSAGGIDLPASGTQDLPQGARSNVSRQASGADARTHAINHGLFFLLLQYLSLLSVSLPWCLLLYAILVCLCWCWCVLEPRELSRLDTFFSCRGNYGSTLLFRGSLLYIFRGVLFFFFATFLLYTRYVFIVVVTAVLSIDRLCG